MKSIYTLLVLALCANAVFAQNEDYYNPVTAPVKPFYDLVTPQINTFKTNREKAIFAKYSTEKIRNRWYIGFDGFIGTDKSTLTNTLQGLVDTKSASRSGYSASIGWVNQEKWGLELEYARSPIHNTLIINNANPLEYKMDNDKNNIAIRAKRRILFGKSNSSVRRSAFWIGAGAGIVPNSGKQKDFMEFEGYIRRTRLTNDTLYLSSDTRTNTKITGFADATAEYVIKVAKAFDLSFYARKRWGLGNSLSTNLDYYVNKVQTQTATIKADGSGWAFGISLRYMLFVGHDEGGKHDLE
ncbi:hypothetical protein [Dyadobacter frigoris]|uniref:Uncharacterized protein n=1 Tax=Dyadobacter frigoris TaxID=2576211 RepID=A0A4U6D1I6_9BACT|nr:hypothetical protein [Dyadobacter frigoris]TKT90972.1 hypothetical protein FDK13_18610 [Dyadobacter frigoris]